MAHQVRYTGRAPARMPMHSATLGIWTADFQVTNNDEAGVVDAVANGTFAMAFEVLNKRLGR